MIRKKLTGPILALKLAALFLPIAGVLIFLEAGLSRVPTSYDVQKAYFEAGLDRWQVLVLGNSQSARGIDPSVWGVEAFNLGHGAQIFYFDRRLLEKYLDRLPKLRLVILTISPRTFEQGQQDDPALNRSYFYAHTYGIPPEHAPTLPDPRRFSRVALYGGIKSLRCAFGGFRVLENFRITPLGFFPTDQRPLDAFDILRFEGRGDREGAGGRQREHDDVILKHMSAVVEGLKKRGIRAVILNPPEPGRAEEGPGQGFLDRAQIYSRAICERHQVLHWDMTEAPGIGKDGFAESYHLNTSGAAKFSRLLKAPVIEALARPGSEAGDAV